MPKKLLANQLAILRYVQNVLEEFEEHKIKWWQQGCFYEMIQCSESIRTSSLICLLQTCIIILSELYKWIWNLNSKKLFVLLQSVGLT